MGGVRGIEACALEVRWVSWIDPPPHTQTPIGGGVSYNTLKYPPPTHTHVLQGETCTILPKNKSDYKIKPKKVINVTLVMKINNTLKKRGGKRKRWGLHHKGCRVLLTSPPPPRPENSECVCLLKSIKIIFHFLCEKKHIETSICSKKTQP